MSRRELFVEWMRWSIENNDCDPSLFLTNYLFDRFEHNREQKLWICWLYGTTYHLPATWVVWNEFPDFELVDVGRLTEWNAKNYKRLRYQTDTKYNKGFLPQQFASYKAWVGDSSQAQKIAQYVKPDCSPEENFHRLFNVVQSDLYKFGRYTTWFYLQTLRHCANIRINADNLKLADYSGSRSHRNGLLLSLDMDALIDTPLSKLQYDALESTAAEMLSEVQQKLPPELRAKADFFAMETCLCSFKKIFRISRGRYLGYYLDRQSEEIQKCEQDGWNGINWKPFWDGRNETVADLSLLGGRIEEYRMRQFLDAGTIDRIASPTNIMDFFA